jgi:MoxR-like ATPase
MQKSVDMEALTRYVVAESAFIEQLNTVTAEVIVGQHAMLERLLIGLLTKGHILLEGMPGLAKTLAIKTLATAVDAKFSRIQFTPDLLPADVVGTTIYNPALAEFTIRKGPIFANFVLADEINRAPAKVQSALLEAMQERQVTIGNETFKLDDPFLVLATQNPIEQEGTYSLPEAQLDRFIFKITMNYPTLEEEAQILTRYKASNGPLDMDMITPLFSSEDIKRVHSLMQEMVVETSLIQYIAAITHRTRSHPKLYLGASPRASLSMLRAGKALAALRGRDFITPEDIQYIALPVLTHRIILTPEAEMEGITTDEVIHQILSEIEIPR